MIAISNYSLPNRIPVWFKEALDFVGVNQRSSGYDIMHSIFTDFSKSGDKERLREVMDYKNTFDTNPSMVWEQLQTRYFELKKIPYASRNFQPTEQTNHDYTFHFGEPRYSRQASGKTFSEYGCHGCNVRPLNLSNSTLCPECKRLKCNNCGSCFCRGGAHTTM